MEPGDQAQSSTDLLEGPRLTSHIPTLSPFASLLPQLNLSLPCCFVCDLGHIIFHLLSLSVFTRKPNKILIMESLRVNVTVYLEMCRQYLL